MLQAFIDENKLGQGFRDTAQKWFIPLAERLKSHHNGAKRTIYVGVNGCQGSGKSTLSAFLCGYLQHTYHLNVVSLSLDDFYLTRSERMAMAVKIHPLFKTRGVPGTHDMSLASSVLDALGNADGNVSIPRFDKSNDDRFEQSQFSTVDCPADIVIFEGWCWGAEAQLTSQLQQPVNEFEAQEDPLGVWRQYINRQIEQAYQPLYEKMDFWLMLKAPSFDNVFSWRLEQEQKLALSEGASGKHIMSEQEVKEFIAYYQRLTEHCIETLPTRCDVVFELAEDRTITCAKERQ